MRAWGSSASDGTRRESRAAFLFVRRPRPRDRTEPDRVRVLRMRVELVHRRLLHLAARVHHDHPIGNVRDDTDCG
jgi:hypothetical protein